MKNIFQIILVVCLFFFFSCDKVEELADIDFNTTIVKSLPVSVSTTNEMTASIVLDATSDPEIKKYADKIKGYQITEILFAIENYSALSENEIYFNGEFGFSKKSENQISSSCATENLNVTHWAGTGDFPLSSTCNNIINEIAGMLVADNAVKVYMAGTFTEEPLSFDLRITVKLKVTANPL